MEHCGQNKNSCENVDVIILYRRPTVDFLYSCCALFQATKFKIAAVSQGPSMVNKSVHHETKKSLLERKCRVLQYKYYYRLLEFDCGWLGYK